MSSTRIPVLTEEQQALCLALAMEGKSLKSIREAVKLTVYDFWLYRNANPAFEQALAQARADGCDELADQLIGITERHIDTVAAGIESANIKWVASRRKPQTYGDRLDLHVQHIVDISQALKDARMRALPATHGDSGQDREIRDLTPATPAGLRPVAATRASIAALPPPSAEALAAARQTARQTRATASPQGVRSLVNADAFPQAPSPYKPVQRETERVSRSRDVSAMRFDDSEDDPDGDNVGGIEDMLS